MPLTIAEIMSIQDEEFAHDVPLAAESVMVLWTEEEVREYFASGGNSIPKGLTSAPTQQPPPADVSDPTPPPAAAPSPAPSPPAPPAQASPPAAPSLPSPAVAGDADPELVEVLAPSGLAHLASVLSGETLDSVGLLERPALLAALKAKGVEKLKDRQAMANVLSKAAKQGRYTFPPSSGTRTSTATELPRPGAAAAARRAKAVSRAGPLPPYRPPSQQTLKDSINQSLPGEWYKLPLPASLKLIITPKWGTGWLTRAFHAAGTLDADDAVTRIVSWTELAVQGVDAQGGAGLKAIVQVEYAKGAANGLHTTLFVKGPWEATDAVGEYNRTLISVMLGDGDGLELQAYHLLEGLLPMRIPKLYFADISRATSNYVLITECVPFAPRAEPTTAATLLDWRDTPPGRILPKSGKYQDDRLRDAHLYYYALVRAMARMAAADSLGVFDEHIAAFGGKPASAIAAGASGVVPLSHRDSASRREAAAKHAASEMDVLIEFITTKACHLFPPPLNTLEWLFQLKGQLIDCAPYTTAISNYLNHPDLLVLSHVNLQIDNGFFWRASESADALECGLLDWYNLKRAPAVKVWNGCLSGCEPEVLKAHESGLMRAFASEYYEYGGPRVHPRELLLMYHLSWPQHLIAQIQFIKSEVDKQGPSAEEWKEIRDVWDPRIMGVWAVRCRVVALLQSLRYWEASNIHATVMGWVEAHRAELKLA